MKTSHAITLFTIIATLGLTSCSKKGDDIVPAQTQATTTPATPTTPTTPTQSTTQTVGLQVKIDGLTFAPDFNYALITYPTNDYYFGIYGLDSKSGSVVVIALPKTFGEGTYPINNINVGMLSTVKTSFSTVNGGTGTVTITKKTATNVIGTFSFTAYDDTYSIKSTLTEGTFNVPFK